MTLSRYAPSVADDPSFIEWQQRYERQAASPAAFRELLMMIDEIDVTDILPLITIPTLILHRTGDLVIPIERVRTLAAAIPGAHLAEFEGCDHFQFVGETEGWLDALEEFATGLPPKHQARRPATAIERPLIQTLGGFAVRRDGHEISLTEWGSRRARQLCKRLAAAAGQPIPRDQLIDMLWPDEDADEVKLNARLSVQLSTVRRVLNGGVIADHASVRLDLDAVRLDLANLEAAVGTQNHAVVVDLYRGPFLPEDPYEDWTAPVRNRAKAQFASACQHLTSHANSVGQPDRALRHTLVWLESDPYDEAAHTAVIGSFAALDRHGEARRAHAHFQECMADIGAPSPSYEEVLRSSNRS